MTNHRIEVGNTGIPQGVLGISNHLPPKELIKPGDTVTFEFGPTFVYLTGLVILATWRKLLPEGVTCVVGDSSAHVAAKSVLTNTGFREVIETGHETPAVSKRLGKLSLRPVTNKFNKDATVQDVTSLLDEYVGHVSDMKPFSTMLSELCENVLSHSEATSPGYVGARVTETPNARRVEIAICDSGIGFLGSFQKGTNEAVKARIKKGASPIDLALDGLNSSKPVPVKGSYLSYYGFGLFIVRRLVEENRGQLTIVSNDEAVSLDRYERKHFKLERPFPGAYVGMVLDLDNPLPLEEIYEQAQNAYTTPLTPSPMAPTLMPATASTGAPVEPPHPAPPSPADGGGRLEIKHFGTELLTREVGLAIRAEIATRLLGFERVTVNLDGISDITPSVADEAFAKLAERLGGENFRKVVVFEGGTSLTRRLIEFVIKTRAR
jgi:hypothetical protein